MAGLDNATGQTGGEVWFHVTTDLTTALSATTRITNMVELGSLKESAEKATYYKQGADYTHQESVFGKLMLEPFDIKVIAGSAITGNSNWVPKKKLFCALEALDADPTVTDKGDIRRFVGIVESVERDHAMNDLYAYNVTIAPSGKPTDEVVT